MNKNVMYRCRLRGRLVCGTCVIFDKQSDAEEALSKWVRLGTEFSRLESVPPLTVLHHCDDKALGVADFAGFD